jgi:hypothetical protein
MILTTDNRLMLNSHNSQAFFSYLSLCQCSFIIANIVYVFLCQHMHLSMDSGHYMNLYILHQQTKLSTHVYSMYRLHHLFMLVYHILE